MRGLIGWALTGVLFAGGLAEAQSRVSAPDNKHNLSVGATTAIRSTGMTEICIVCHTPHSAAPAAPLWNHTASGAAYTSYASTTQDAPVGAPGGSSKLCLSCHDGTVALGGTLSMGTLAMQGTASGGRLGGASVIGPDLRSSHPISFVPVVSAGLVSPPAGSAVKLDASGQVQCRTCHDPHTMDLDATTKKFLVMNNSASALCLACHTTPWWSSTPASHRISTTSYAAAQGAHTGYATVATNGCESCHRPHTAASPQRSLKAAEELTCGGTGTQCHSSTGIGRNLQAEFAKTYTHPTYSITPSAHDASEAPGSLTFPMPETTNTAARHAECPDCHNAHASAATPATAPKGSGKLAGVWGIDTAGVVVQPSGSPPSVKEYEICFRCHAGSANKPQVSGGPAPPYPNRVALQFDMRLLFDPAAASFHPVAAVGRNASVPSLVAPWTTASQIYCSDCHDNDTGPKAAPTPGTGPAGTHGSNIKHLLAGRYDMDLGSSTESATVYALCYKCHSRTSILANQSFPTHRMHIVDERSPCSLCHDPHGVAASQGNATNNSNLINFDKRFVTPSSSGILRFDDLGNRRGRCYLTCHGENHNPRSY